MATHTRPLLVLALGAFLSACGSGSTPPAAPAQSDVAALQSLDLKVGDGATVAAGQMASVNYTGWLYEASAKDHKGKEFDSSLKTGKPFTFPVGAQQVIKGWDQGVVGMKVGGSRRLTIPPDLAYGDSGAGGVIPPGATLVFDVELVSIQQ
jgi:FKBP-type peptidyl-prolyl cis-trans isomerase FkpA